MKYLIHNGETYYPGADEFTKIEDAIKAFRKLREERIERIQQGGDLFFSKDYLCVIIEENDPITLAKENPIKPDHEEEPPEM